MGKAHKMNKKKPVTPKDNQPAQVDYTSLVVRLLPIFLVSSIQLSIIGLLVVIEGFLYG